jgi:hypothetical protein
VGELIVNERITAKECCGHKAYSYVEGKAENELTSMAAWILGICKYPVSAGDVASILSNLDTEVERFLQARLPIIEPLKTTRSDLFLALVVPFAPPCTSSAVINLHSADIHALLEREDPGVLVSTVPKNIHTVKANLRSLQSF